MNRGRACLLIALMVVAFSLRAESDLDPGLLATAVVVESTPLPGAEIDRDKLSAPTVVLNSADISRTGIPSLTDALLTNVPSASINDTEGNVFQPDILFRGFTASPVAGTPEGIAVYVNGARFNDAFGDTVNWDVIPPIAIKAATLEASNPLFGLNALGGAVSIRLKNGFDSPGDNVTLYGGSYGRESAILEVGRQWGPFAIYLASDATHDGGFRQTNASDLYRLYMDLGWRQTPLELHLGVHLAHDALGNPGATPVQALAANLSNIFTAPNVVENNYAAGNLNGVLTVTDTVSLSGVAYFQQLNQTIPNGTTSEVAGCDDGSGLLCNSDGTVVTTFNNTPVTDFLNGGTYSGLSVQQLNSHAYGVSAQLADTAPLGGHANSWVGGASFDGSGSTFAGIAELGGFDPYTREFLGPGVVQDQPGEGVNPVRVASTTKFYSVFFTDVFKLADPLELNIAGRYNEATIELTDELGGPVNGDHTFSRFNPGAGLTYSLSEGLQAYASYVETNRTPTPQELSCASPAAPCSLLNFFVGDPNLAQVVARTAEAGLRGHSGPHAGWSWRWNVDYYHTADTNDIIYETTTYNPNLAYYTNAGRALRQGAEANLHLETPHLRLVLGYAFTDATFRSPLLLGTNSPAADVNGDEQVVPGDRIPGIPRERGTLIVDLLPTPEWTFGVSVVAQSNSYRFGDEANLTQPIGGYTIMDVNAAWHPTPQFTLFAVVNNVFDRGFYTYGSFGPVGDVPWPNVPGGVTDPRTASPGTPRAAFGGLRFSF